MVCDCCLPVWVGWWMSIHALTLYVSKHMRVCVCVYFKHSWAHTLPSPQLHRKNFPVINMFNSIFFLYSISMSASCIAGFQDARFGEVGFWVVIHRDLMKFSVQGVQLKWLDHFCSWAVFVSLVVISGSNFWLIFFSHALGVQPKTHYLHLYHRLPFMWFILLWLQLPSQPALALPSHILPVTSVCVVCVCVCVCCTHMQPHSLENYSF